MVFFPWSCFIGIPVIKTWCSLGALMWPAARAGPSLLLPSQGERVWLFGVLRNPWATCLTFPVSSPPPPPVLRSPSLKVVSNKVQRTQAPCTPPQVVTPAACVTCWVCLASLLPFCRAKNKTKQNKTRLLIGEKTGLRNPARCERVIRCLPALNNKARFNGDFGPMGGS